jgi:MFS transporter, ACS family, hexuronate transporter
MATSVQDTRRPVRGPLWKWTVCGLLLLATMINYMDRLTINQTAGRIKDELGLNDEQYGRIEFAFGVAFALGALVVGWSADRWNVRWLYAASVLAWSAAGFVTGFARDLLSLMACRFALGVFESGNWPCALRTTQRILRPDERTLGNSILQSGAALGAIITPLVVLVLVRGPGTWRLPFFVIGAAGTVWVLGWLFTVGRDDLTISEARLGQPHDGSSDVPLAGHDSLSAVFRDARFWALVVVGITINLTWHFFRVWLPLYLRESRGYTDTTVNWFTSAYYLSTDAGSLAAGFTTLWLARRGMPVHRTRVAVLLGGALLATLSLAVAALPTGPWLLVLLLALGFGALALFPPYYSLSQELTVRHQGKLTGTLSCIIWLSAAIMHPLVGRWLDATGKDYAKAVALAGLPPLVGVLAVVLLWRPARPPAGKLVPPETRATAVD